MPVIGGLDLSNLYETTQEELQEHLRTRWTRRGPLYELYATSLMADYNPEFLKLHWLSAIELNVLPSQRGEPLPANPRDSAIFRQNEPMTTIPQLYSYIHLGWETGIRNEFRELKRLGLTRAMTMEIVMFARLSAGMRGLGHTYHGVGDFLPDYGDGHGKPEFPDGWTADPEAFKSGLDMTTRELTEADRKNLTAWYEKNVGYLPKSVGFGIKHDPQFLKLHRRMWEVAIRTLPKQVAPYLMLRDGVVNNDREGLREAALLGKAWGMSPDWIVRGIMYSVHYFTGLRGLYVAQEAVDDLL
jgi:hypothetical protein